MKATARRIGRGPAESRRAFAPLRILAVAILAALTLLVPAATGGPGVATALAMGPLPACRYDTILTAPRRYVDWRITLVDTILRVPNTYVPPDLVSTSLAGVKGGGSIRGLAIQDLKTMATAARAAGAPIAVESAYRSYAQQKVTFQHWVDTLGYAQALKVSARPGHSEHQLGLAIDFRSDSGGPPWQGGDWALSPAGAWMKAHAWQYGWVLSYPKGAIDTVCYSYEPWHYRYVGRPLAAQIHTSGLTIRETLWRTYTTSVVPAASTEPGGSGTIASALPSESPSLEPTATASPIPTPTAPVPTPTAPTATTATVTIPSPGPTPATAVATDFAGTPVGVVLVLASLAVLAVLGLGVALALRRSKLR